MGRPCPLRVQLMIRIALVSSEGHVLSIVCLGLNDVRAPIRVCVRLTAICPSSVVSAWLSASDGCLSRIVCLRLSEL